MGDVHNRTRYLAGCRCDTCKKAQSDYRRSLRQRKAQEALEPAEIRPLAAVPTPPSAPASPAIPLDEVDVESNVARVQREIDGLVAADDKPGHVGAALTMARLLDNPIAFAQHPSAAAKLVEIMAVLARGGKKRRGKLAAVKDMTSTG